MLCRLASRAAEPRITSTVRYFAKVDTKQRQLFPSTLFAWKENYLKELSKRQLDKDQGVDELPPKKRGRPPLLVTELDHQVQLYVKKLRANILKCLVDLLHLLLLNVLQNN